MKIRLRNSTPTFDQNGFPVWRETCLKCIRPSSHCYCSENKPFKAHCNLLILQHPHERKKYYSTARIVLQNISNSKLIMGVEFDESYLKEELSKSNFYLLYPGKDAKDCETMPLTQNDSILVLDGTWSEAGKILHRNPILKCLPKISFNRPLISEYKIRKQPKERYLSTLESIGHLLKLNADANPGFNIDVSKYDQLFSAFNKMVNRQLKYFPRFQNLQETIDPIHTY